MSAIPTTATGWQPGNPTNMRATFLRGAWGFSSVNGHKMAEFCPMCLAMVPYEDDHGPKAAHIDFHVKLAEHVSAITVDA